MIYFLEVSSSSTALYSLREGLAEYGVHRLFLWGGSRRKQS